MNNKYNRKIVFFILTIIISTLSVSAQRITWSVNRESVSGIVTDKAVKRQSFPKEFKLFDLNIEPLRDELSSIVDSKSGSTVISLPNADGSIERFEVFEASNFEPELQAKFPEIRAFSGRGLTDRYATVKLSTSPQGVSGTVFRAASNNLVNVGDGETEFIEPYSADQKTYAVYRSNRNRGELPWVCGTQDRSLFTDWKAKIPVPDVVSSNEGTIRTLRLVQSCNGEYANYFGATSAADVAKVLAGFNATLTRANGVYERDLGLHLNLIPQTTSVIFYDPATDPYSTTLSDWNQQLQTTLTNTVGSASYDIGHMFGASGGGGNAGCIGCVCVNPTSAEPLGKGSGITSPSDGIPVGDNFDIDFVTHEMGHQLGGNHTFSFGQLPIPEMMGQDKEVGSGITIMGYAGVTTVNDVAPHSIDSFHETSIGQIQTNLATKGCSMPVTNTNHAPVIAPLSNYTIPITTPFKLTGSATDADGDSLTYNWEQDDSAQDTGATLALALAQPAKVIGPNWLSFPSTSSPTKLFPKLSTILAGQFTTAAGAGSTPGILIEALSSITRDLHFRLTVRDNHPYIPNVATGQTQFKDMTVSVTNLAGPFLVVQPNMNETYTGGSTQTVIWTVANTNVILGTANVNIKLSTDGGQTFPITLKANTPNDGTESVVMPNTGTTTARIMVEAVGNIFFDISNTNFTITGPAAPQGIESDVQPRSAGDGVTDADDIQQIRRFAVGLDTPYQSNEFQRADSSPRSTSGDQSIDAEDVQQARRYSVGTDAVQPAGGPNAPSGFSSFEDYSSKPLLEQIIGTENSKADESFRVVKERGLRVDGSKASVNGQTMTIPVLVNATGDEAGYTFSLKYDAAMLSNPIVSIGSAGGDVVSNVNRAGEIGFSITSFNGGTIAAGADQLLVNVQFTFAATAKSKMTPIVFSSSLARQKATGVDPNTPIEQPVYTDGVINFGRSGARFKTRR